MSDNAKPELSWIEADKNPWGLRLVDLRPITLNMISSSKDPLAAKNAVSYNGEDGSSFRGMKPENAATVETTLSFVTDGRQVPIPTSGAPKALRR